jgi:hypothetical protein
VDLTSACSQPHLDLSCSNTNSLKSTLSFGVVHHKRVVISENSLQHFTQRRRCVMATIIKDQPDPQHGRLPYSRPFAHSCSFCQVQEIDSGMKPAWSNGSFMDITARYRGTRVFEGASNKCAFFAHCLQLLAPTMRSIRSEQASPPNLSQLKNWVYQINFWTRCEPKSLENGIGRWRYVGGVLPLAVILPEHRHYVPIAAQSEYILRPC